MSIIISIINQKGGVGKTTITFNLSKELSSRKYKVLVIDNDPQANLTSCFLEDPVLLPPEANILCWYEDKLSKSKPLKITEHLHLLGSNIHLSRISDKGIEVIYALKEGCESVKDSYDFIIIDCLPSFGYLNLASLNCSDFVLVPTKPAPFATAGLQDLFDSVEKAQRRMNPGLKSLGIVLNLVEGKNTNLAKDIEKVLRSNYNNQVFNTILQKGVKFEESPALNLSVSEYDPTSKSSEQFVKFTDEFLERISM
jgi:chromosome partitioning protein